MIINKAELPWIRFFASDAETSIIVSPDTRTGATSTTAEDDGAYCPHRLNDGRLIKQRSHKRLFPPRMPIKYLILYISHFTIVPKLISQTLNMTTNISPPIMGSEQYRIYIMS